LMIKEGALENPKPEAIFGLHVTAPGPSGAIFYRAGGYMAGSDTFRITVKGRGTHGAQPWAGVDPIVLASQIVLGLQTIESRQVDVTSSPSVLTVGMFNAGNRSNIIVDNAELVGTLRTFNPDMREFIMRRVNERAELIAKSGGGDASVEWRTDGAIPLINSAELTNRMAQRTSSTPAALYSDGKFRRFVQQVWDWQDDRHYVVHLFITMQMPDGWHTRHFVGQYRAITPSDVAALAVHAGFDDVRVLAPDETGYYQPVIRAVAPAVSSSG